MACGPGMEMIELIEYHKELEKYQIKESLIVIQKIKIYF